MVIAAEKRSSGQDSRSQHGGAEKINARQETLLIIVNGNAGDLIRSLDGDSCLRPASIGARRHPNHHGGHQQERCSYAQKPSTH